MFIAAVFTIAKRQKQPKCPSTDEWVKQMWFVYTHTHTHIHTNIWILPTIKRSEIMPFGATWMDLEIILLSEVSQTDKDK